MPKYRWTWAVPTALYCAVIFFLSAQPDLGKDPPWWLDWPQSDKLVHLVLFGGLAGLVAIGLIRSNGRSLPWTQLFFVPVAFTTLYGLSDEIHQYFVPPRSADVLDLCADAAGATIIAGVIAAWRARTAPAAPAGRHAT